jgi:hypothetical protein
VLESRELMIHPTPDCQARFDGDDGRSLAEFEFQARFPNGEIRDAKLVLGYPFRRTGFEDCFSLRAELEGLETTMGPVMTGDSVTLLIFAPAGSADAAGNL